MPNPFQTLGSEAADDSSSKVSFFTRDHGSTRSACNRLWRGDRLESRHK